MFDRDKNIQATNEAKNKGGNASNSPSACLQRRDSICTRVASVLSRADMKKFHSGMRILEYTRIKATYRISLKENFLLSNCKALLCLDHLLQSKDC